ncbi:hypothetical protein [Candidatus Nitrosocosmicus sp. R]
MNIMYLIVIAVAISTITLIGVMTSSTQGQTPTASDLPMTTINETNSTIQMLNKTLPAENATDVVPEVPM